jgi:hypothetical protein
LSYLEPANERIVDLVGEELRTGVLEAGPAPHVLVVAVVPRVLQDGDGEDPHDHAHDEPANGKERVVNSHFLGPPVAATAVSHKDKDADEEGQARCGQHEGLWPDAGVCCPGREVVLGRQCLSGVEDGKRGSEHGQDNQAAAEVDAPQCHLCEPYTRLDFLWEGLALSSWASCLKGKAYTRSLACSFSVDSSLFSSSCSSLKVGLRGLRPRPGVPGAFMALLSGDLGLMGTAADSLLLLIYPNPISPGCDWGTTFLSPKPFPVDSTGEWMLVASANRGVLGGLPIDDVEEEESVDDDRTGWRLRAAGRFLSSFIAIATL